MTVSYAKMANAIRALAMDAVQKANSGHPGLPMGMADVATQLFSRQVKFYPNDPDWPDRDRFVLSAGHGSMLLYSVLHLLGYGDMTMDEIRNFRQWQSRTPGHPELGAASGIETTTGPLGQGLATAVGMALAERLLAARFGSDLVDHRTYVIASDGDLMEGISHEAISFAGHLKLAKLVVLFDDNSISIDGAIGLTESTDQIGRFKAAGWHAENVDGHDPEAVSQALDRARQSDKPSLIACRTTIGYGAPHKAGTAATHGAPLGEDEIAGARIELGWDYAPFEIPNDVLSAWRAAGLRSEQSYTNWQDRFAALSNDQQKEFKRVMAGDLPSGFADAMRELRKRLAADPPQMATRKASEIALEVINDVIPETVGGSADLTGSNNTRTKDLKEIATGDFSGRFIHYGVREHGMAAIMNGMARHGGIIPYSGTFLVFADYCRPSIRLAALMKQRVIYVMTHDSIGLGEDGPTHQPIEHLASLRAIPNLNVFRPADAMETAECWELALNAKQTPSVIALTRQTLTPVRRQFTEENMSARGAYELMAAQGTARVTIIATGSEIGIAVAARDILQADGIGTRIVSMPSWELFDRQPNDYRSQVLGPGQVRIAVEAAIGQGWEKYIGSDGVFIGLSDFGASAPYKQLYEQFSVTPEAVAKAAQSKL